MLKKTKQFKEHPLFTQLQLAKINSFPIGEKELLKTFIVLCNKQDFDNLSILLDFDYQSLSQLSTRDPFYLASDPFNVNFFIKKITAANSLNRRKTSLFLQKHIDPYIQKKLSSTDMLDLVKAIRLIALCQPKLAYEHLSKLLSQTKEIEHFYGKKEYKFILDALLDLAASKKYFQYSADIILAFASKEIELNTEKDDSLASSYFSTLFQSTGTKITTSLEDRQKYLITAIEKSEKEKKQNPLSVLIEALGVAANIFNQEAQSSNQDPFYLKYINMAVVQLARFAGNNNILSEIAEKKLHHLLQSIIIEPNLEGGTEVTYLIFKLFLHYNKSWHFDPFSCLIILDAHIKSLKTEFISEMVALLIACLKENKMMKISSQQEKSLGESLYKELDENFSDLDFSKNEIFEKVYNLFSIQRKKLRIMAPAFSQENLICSLKNKASFYQEKIRILIPHLERLKSLKENRSFIAEDFTLHLSAKKPEKICKIDALIDPETKLELHEQQSLAERLIAGQTTELSKIKRDSPHYVYLVANFGLLVSDRTHKKGGDHQRVFKSIPIKFPHQVIAGGKKQGHAEEQLYAYMLEEETIKYILTEFRKKYHLDDIDHKVYAAVFDLHGTYDMCVSCSQSGEKFQNQFREKLLGILKNENMKTLQKYPTQLPVIIRYSSNTYYHYYSKDAPLDKQGVLQLINQQGKRRNLDQAENGSFSERDIKKFGANLLLHGDSKWHHLWVKKRNDYYNKPLFLPSFTAFLSSGKYSQLSDEVKRKNYTRAGQVETASPIENLPNINKLSVS